ncbi:hypothetical protein [Streptomyces sp. NPDC002044]|uniref:hypothetical protein n=1 Tax=Streptomyces sp. NPDC002044 TaxID=3154662 RepID=UPI00332A15D5
MTRIVIIGADPPRAGPRAPEPGAGAADAPEAKGTAEPPGAGVAVAAAGCGPS